LNSESGGQTNRTSLIPQQAQIQQKDATLKGAELNKSYTKVYASSDGYIAKRSVEVGIKSSLDNPIAVVPLDDIWITANYKETQLERVKPGQMVKIIVDTYPGKVFYGKVESVQAGTVPFSLSYHLRMPRETMSRSCNGYPSKLSWTKAQILPIT